MRAVLATFKLIDNVSFGGASKKRPFVFKKSYYRIELLLLEERNDKKISGPAKFPSGTDKNPAFTRYLGSRISQIVLKSTRDLHGYTQKKHYKNKLQDSMTKGSDWGIYRQKSIACVVRGKQLSYNPFTRTKFW